MQTLQQQQQVFKIEEKERKDSILEILSDKYCRTILESTMYVPKSATEITAEANIPLSTVYRRIQTLYDSKLLTGSGTPFGGMALVAELNSHPGPRHVLDTANAGELELTDKQYGQIQTIFDEMRSESIELGKQIIDIEREMDDAFENGTMTEHELQKKVSKSAELYGKLRLTHLKSHLSMMEILTPPQVEQYDQLRGYTSDNPCENVPEGHDPEMWKLHHNCK